MPVIMIRCTFPIITVISRDWGAIKFGELIQFLKARNYQGRLAIEGNLNVSFIEDVKTSMKYLIPLLS